MDRLRNELFSSSSFSLDQYRAVQARDRVNQFKNSIHCPASADDVAETVPLIQLFLQILVFEPKLPLLEAFSNHDRQFDQFEGLGQIVVCPLLDRGHGCFDGTVARDDDPDGLRVPEEHFFQQLDPCLSRQVVVGDQDVIRRL